MTEIKTNKMLVNVVLDRSASMGSTRAETVAGYNEYLNGLRKDTDSEYSVTHIQFDTHGPSAGPSLTVLYDDRPLDEVKDLTLADYAPRGMTPLYDAIGECVRRIDAKDRAVTVVVITDGAENSSKEFTQESVKALIKSKESEGWTFVFIGAEIDSYAVGGSVGMSAGNTSNYTKGMEHALYSNLAQATMTRSAMNQTVGVERSACMSFFEDSQKSAMGDTTIDLTGLVPTVTAPPTTISLGGQHSTITFPCPSAPIKTHLERHKRRTWKTETPVSK